MDNVLDLSVDFLLDLSSDLLFLTTSAPLELSLGIFFTSGPVDLHIQVDRNEECEHKRGSQQGDGHQESQAGVGRVTMLLL